LKSRKSEGENCFINLNSLESDFIDTDKLIPQSSDYERDFKNYILFQKFPFFRWPHWLSCAIDSTSPLFSPLSPLYLPNRVVRNHVSFSNLLTTESISIDPSGMLTPSYDSWSIELWLYTDTVLRRPQGSLAIMQQKDMLSSIVTTTWREHEFELTETVFGARTDIDEAIVEIACTVKRKFDFALFLFVVRPYTITTIGGIESVEYKKASKLIAVNRQDVIVAGTNPDLVTAGNGHDGDIEVSRSGKDELTSRCQYTMATLALGYRLKQGDNSFRFRISMNRGKGIKAAKLNYNKLRKDFSEFTRLKGTEGFNLDIPDSSIMAWFNASKRSLLQVANPRNFIVSSGKKVHIDMRALYYITLGYNRMGFFQESLSILDFYLSHYSHSDEERSADIVRSCYFLCALSDYFTHSRNLDFLQSRYGVIKNVAAKLFEYAKNVKNKKKWLKTNDNSVSEYFVSGPHYHDLILLAHSLREFSYLSRCIGLFGEEIAFNKEADRLEQLIQEMLFVPISKPSESEEEDEEIVLTMPDLSDEFAVYNVLAGFPFKLNFVTENLIQEMLGAIARSFPELPLFITSRGGWDSFSSIIVAINHLFVGDRRAFDVLFPLMDVGKECFALPDVVNPVSGTGVYGLGDSKIVLSLFYILIRNFLYIDLERRLVIFPIPHEKWFVPGKEIVVRQAPSRFGYLNFKIITTKNEIQVHFNELPQYLPPDILINLPCKTKIVQEDDFIVKKEFQNSYVISGWPSVVRCIIS